MGLREYQAATGLRVNVNSTTFDGALLLTNGQQYLAEEPQRGPVLIGTNPEQAWFWTGEWQAGEHEAEEDLREGRYQDLDTAEDIDAFYDSL